MGPKSENLVEALILIALIVASIGVGNMVLFLVRNKIVYQNSISLQLPTNQSITFGYKGEVTLVTITIYPEREDCSGYALARYGMNEVSRIDLEETRSRRYGRYSYTRWKVAKPIPHSFDLEFFLKPIRESEHVEIARLKISIWAKRN